MDRVLIQHPDGRQFDIPLSAFRADGLVRDPSGDALSSYDAAGFVIVGYADGRPYSQPEPTPAASSPAPSARAAKE